MGSDAISITQPAMTDMGSEAGIAMAVEARSAGKTFPDGTRALAPVDLAVRKGEFLSLLGPSGCGKSTLLRMMAGLLAPSEGQVRAASGKLGYVFQDPTLMPWATVHANVRLPLELARQNPRVMDERVAKALAAVGLEDAAGRRPRELSGGMRMRVSLARALVDEPALMLMDEPFGALDEITRGRLDADLLQLWRARGLTVVFVTHSIYEAVYLSTRVVVMSQSPGRIVGELCIDEPQPRADSFRLSPGFSRYCSHLSGLLAGASSR